MNYALIDLSLSENRLSELATKISAEIVSNKHEEFISVHNESAKGVVRLNSFGNGLSVLSLEITLDKQLTFKLANQQKSPSHFIFASEGNLFYYVADEYQTINRYQNVVIGAANNTRNHFTLPNSCALKFTIINVDVAEFSKNRKHLNYFNDYSFENIFKISEAPYLHLGSYSLKIADELTKYWESENYFKDIQYLKTEGHILLILSLQLSAYKNQIKGKKNYEYLERRDVDRIENLTKFIEQNIGENITINSLVNESGMHAKKLQAGFQVLYNKSINEFIRELKLKIAISSLENTNESISEIVYKIGFKSRSYFSKIFLEQYGILPMDFRKKMNNKKSAN